MLNLVSLHHVRVEVVNLDGNERFVRSFGMLEAGREGDAIYYRTNGPDAYSYVVQPGARSGLVSMAFAVAGRSDLEHAASLPGATPIHRLTGPGGGEAVSLTDPEGTRVDLVFGIEPRVADPLPAPMVFNHPTDRRRFNAEPTYPAHGPSTLLRVGHLGLYVRDFGKAEAWYCNTLGLVPSDRLYAGAPHNYIGGFYRLNRGSEYVDHHVVGLFGFGKSEVHHISFEVPDIEHQFFAHRYMEKQDFELVWGVGRHPKGSHVFDVWKDPNGLRFETFTDTDLVNLDRATDDIPVEKMEMDMWSNQSYQKYFA